MDDDFEVEVTDLRTGQVLKTAHEVPSPPSPPAAATDDGFELEVTNLPVGAGAPEEALKRSRFVRPPGQGPSRRQMTGAVATGALIVVVLVGLLGGIVGKGSLPVDLFPTPVPTATLALGANEFYLVNGVPWGKLLADGKVVNVAYSQQQPAFFTLPIGRHTIEYDAPPFPKMQCTTSVPAARTDSCSLYTPPEGDWASQYGITDTNRGLDLGETLTRLPPDTLQALVNAAAQSLATPVATTTVPAGGRYQGASGKMLVATEPLRAQIFYTLYTNANSTLGGNCVSLCDLSFGDGGDSGNDWQIMANIVPIWHYTNAAGTTVQLPATPQLPGAPTYQSGGPGDTLFLAVSWQGADGWQVHPISISAGPNPACFDAGDALENVLSQDQAFMNGLNGPNSNEIDAPNPADGCLIAIGESDGNGGLVGKPLWFLYRFGLIFAANATAHQAIPSLPVASGLEARLASQLATQLQPPFNG